MAEPRITAETIKEAIKRKHAEDVCVIECKDGPSGGGVGIMDAWVMPRSWAHPDITAYEIKVTRQDFIRDDKWPKYLDCCNMFYFVCPWKMIQPEEVPEGTGLCWLSQTGTKLFIKRKAPHRNVKIPEGVFRYILMCRTELKGGEIDHTGYERDYWTEWLKEKKLDYEFGWRVSKSIRDRVETEITKVTQRQNELDKKLERYAWVEQHLIKLGITEHTTWGFENAFNKKMKEVESGIDQSLIECLQSHKSHIEKALQILERNDKEQL